LARKAATQTSPEHPPLKDPKDFRLLGTRVPRLDTPAKVNGSAKFGIDVTVPGMLIASVERSPVFGGKVKSFDAAKAKSLPGVRHVVPLEATPWKGSGSWGVGTASGVAVVADTYWQAVQGRRALDVTWDDGPNAALGDIPAKLTALAAQPGVIARTDGDAATALAGAAKRVEAFYELPFLHHATMEPMNCTAHVRANGCDVWAPTQNQSGAQDVAVAITGLPKDAVHIHTTLLGGGFGRRLESDFVAFRSRCSGPGKTTRATGFTGQRPPIGSPRGSIPRAGLSPGRIASWGRRFSSSSDRSIKVSMGP
jgi:isoquinoline 1-oxidoreductase beta subunit